MQGDVVALLGQHLHAPYPMTYTERTTRPSLVRPSHGTHLLLILAPVKDNDTPKDLSFSLVPNAIRLTVRILRHHDVVIMAKRYGRAALPICSGVVREERYTTLRTPRACGRRSLV